MVCFPRFLQLADKLVEQVLHCFLAASCAEPGQCAVVRSFSVLQQPSEVDAVLTGLLQLAAGIDPAQIAVDQYLEQHPGLRRRFSPFGRIRFVQFPVLQFLKLGA